MNLIEFLMHLDDDRIVEAIRSAELRTSGEIRVFVAREKIPDPLPSAIEQFQKMGMSQTRRRNAVLIFIAPRSQTFAILGDEGLHQHVGQAFWDEVMQQMRSHFRESPTAAIVHAIERIAVQLAQHFPRESDDQNELPDQVERG